MKIFKPKNKNEKGCYYFGEMGEIPLGVSLAEFEDTDSILEDQLHFHQKGVEFYFVIQGKIEMLIENSLIKLEPRQLLMVDPGERHKVKRLCEAPVSWLTFCTRKDHADKVVCD